MKSLNIGVGGHRFFAPDDLTQLNEAVQELAAGLAGAYGSSSCFLGNSIPAVAAGFWTIAAGYMIYKGEVCAYDAQNVADVGGQTLVWEPIITYRALDPIVYADASSHSPHEIKKVRLKFYAALPGDYVENSAMLTAGSAIRSMTQESGFVVLGLLNGWANGARIMQYSKQAGNGVKIYLRGILAGGAATNTIFGNLPAGYRPSDEVRIPVADDAGNIDAVVIQANGDMLIRPDGGGLGVVAANIYIDVSFTLI